MMDNRRIDAVAKRFASNAHRRTVLKGLFGLAGAVAIGASGRDEADAARRGFSGPRTSQLPPGGGNECLWTGSACSYDRPGECCSNSCYAAVDPDYPVCA